MYDLFLLTRRGSPDRTIFSFVAGVARVDNQRMISGIIFVIRNGLRWHDAPREYRPHKTVYNRFVAGAVLMCSTDIAELALGRHPEAVNDRRAPSEGASHPQAF